MAIISLDGAAFRKFLAAGAAFLRKYRGVLNDLNVFPVPDGDTGSNMYLTARAALSGARPAASAPLAAAAEAAARAGLLGARGNSGAILSQMLRGFAHAVRDRESIDTVQLAAALGQAVNAARAALSTPVDGTMLTVAQSAADEAYRFAPYEPDFRLFLAAVVQAANESLDRTPEQLAVLKEAGVVDAGGAGLCYFLEGVLRFEPGELRATAFPRRPERARVFTAAQHVGEHRFCTEFILEDATIDVQPLRELLAPHGESLIVAGSMPTLKVHVHTAGPDDVRAVAAKYGRLTRFKVEDMAEQHHVLVVDVIAKPYAIVVVVPGPGFERIARELGADVTISSAEGTPSATELLIGVNAVLAERVYLLPNDPEITPAALDAAGRTAKNVLVVPTSDILAGLAAQLAIGTETPAGAAAAAVRSAAISYQDARSIRDQLLDAVHSLGGDDGGLVTLYYGGRQVEADAQRYAAVLGERFADVSVEYYYGGQRAIEYWVSFER